MKQLKFFVLIIFAIGFAGRDAYCQNMKDDYESFKKQAQKDYGDFKKKSREEYEAFRKKVNEEYAEFLKNPWKEFKKEPVIPKPKDEEVPPKPIDEEEKDKAPIDNPIPIKEILPPAPEPEPQPLPVVPIYKEIEQSEFEFWFFGTKMTVDLGDKNRFSLPKATPEAVSKVWTFCCRSDFNNVIRDCLKLRINHKLNDWAYLLMLREMGEAFFGKNTNEAMFLAGFIYCQSGYKIRWAANSIGQLNIGICTEHQLFGKTCYSYSGGFIFLLDDNQNFTWLFSESEYTGEKLMSLYFNYGNPKFDFNNQRPRSVRYNEGTFDIPNNKNLIDLYDKYPTSTYLNEIMTRWAMYAETPLSQETKDVLYPRLKNMINGKNSYDAVRAILNFINNNYYNNFPYGYDDEIWGGDRAFFPEETIYYPLSDCEDHAILFARLVRDLLGYDVLLVYVPGHLTAAVDIPNGNSGDYLTTGNRIYTICDPTYFGSNPGQRMPDLDYSAPLVINVR